MSPREQTKKPEITGVRAQPVYRASVFVLTVYRYPENFFNRTYYEKYTVFSGKGAFTEISLMDFACWRLASPASQGRGRISIRRRWAEVWA